MASTIMQFLDFMDHYADYRKARDEMRELLTVKANVDRLMGYDEQEKEAEATRQEDQR